MSRLIKLRIDVTKLRKERFFKGSKGTYVSLDCWIEDVPDEFGKDASISEDQTVEERASKVPRHYVGFGKKVFGWGRPSGDQVAPKPSVAQQQAPVSEDDIPF